MIFVFISFTLAFTGNVIAIDWTSRVMLRSHLDPHAFTMLRLSETCFTFDPTSGNVDAAADTSFCSLIEGWAGTTDAEMIRTHLEICLLCAGRNDDFSFFSFIDLFICVTDDPHIGKLTVRFNHSQ